jgi:hypothetical protein
VKVGGVNVAVGDDGAVREQGKRRCDASFSGSAFAADYREFVHGLSFAKASSF